VTAATKRKIDRAQRLTAKAREVLVQALYEVKPYPKLHNMVWELSVSCDRMAYAVSNIDVARGEYHAAMTPGARVVRGVPSSSWTDPRWKNSAEAARS
jgi:hypothetical protein